MQHQHLAGQSSVCLFSHRVHQHPTRAIVMAMLSVCLLTTGCGKSDSIASADPSPAVVPETTVVSTEVANTDVEGSNAEMSNAEPVATATSTSDATSEPEPTTESAENTESVETTESVSAETPVAEEDEQFFMVLESAMNDEDRAVHQAVGQDKALQLAQTACQNFDQGKTFNQIANDVVGGLQASGLEGEELQKTAYYSGKVMGVGVAVFCPQHRSQIEGQNG